MMRCTCCGRWTVEAVWIDRMRGAQPRIAFYRVFLDSRVWDEYLTLQAMELELSEQGVFEYLAELPEAA